MTDCNIIISHTPNVICLPQTKQQHFNHNHHKIFRINKGNIEKKNCPELDLMIHCCQTNSHFFFDLTKGMWVGKYCRTVWQQTKPELCDECEN